MLQLIAYLMLVLVNLMPGPESEFLLGWVLIGVICLMFAANFGLMVVLNVSLLCRKIYLIYLREKHRRHFKTKTINTPVDAVFRRNPQEKQSERELLGEQGDKTKPNAVVLEAVDEGEELEIEVTVRDLHNVT